ncbi:MAG: trehalose-phosphatase [Actinomycetota bacterium]|nr:MAG: trehalose-phosphatase [Actinomycetota bacterium]
MTIHPSDVTTPGGPEQGPEPLDSELRQALRQLARTPHLLVCCDYDGTLAPIVPNPTDARPLPESITALRNLAAMPSTTAAVISGRSLRDLAALSRLPGEVHLVGSHGSEFDIGYVTAMDDDNAALLRRVDQSLAELTDGVPGVSLERKPASIAVHVRRADPDAAATVLRALDEGPVTWPGVHVTKGKEVVELAVVETNKGSAVDILRHRTGATAAIFVGDDATDERAFARLHGPDISVKVGPGDSLAQYRIADPHDVARLLAMMVEERLSWLTGVDAVPIERLSLLADGASVALVTPHGAISWLCHPDPDSPAVFAHLLGGEAAGHFSVHPVRQAMPLAQAYVADTWTLRTRWPGLDVLDYLEVQPPNDGTRRHARLVRVLQGTARARVVFAPRPEFGGVPVRLQPGPDGVVVVGSAEPMVLHAPGLDWEVHRDGMHDTAVATVDPGAGSVVLELRLGTDDLSDRTEPEPERRARTESYWRSWVSGLRLPATRRAAVVRSALTLKALCYQPTGAVLAAATASLPEQIGGIRNWDYRYCWPRDASMSVEALVQLGSTAEADAFLDWLAGVLETVGRPEQLHPLYTIFGRTLGAEAVVDTLPGYAGSRPVRVSNAAQGQLQLDVFGPVASLLAVLADERGAVSDRDWLLAQELVAAVEARWYEPDHGIWEIRDVPRHHVHSRVMCWQTVDRGLTLAAARGVDRPDWKQLRDRIAENLFLHGTDPQTGAFGTAFESRDADAATLAVILSGMLDGSDPRAQATVAHVESELRRGPTVHRYLFDDGLPGHEGGMHICTGWLIEAYLAVGRHEDAEQLFEAMLATAGPTGLLPEQYDGVRGRSLGNHPQAYSHLSVIRAALLFDAIAR